MDSSSNKSLAPSTRVLIEETADVLERIGTNPPHRNGVSAVYGRHLRHVLNTGGQQTRNAQPENVIQPSFAIGSNELLNQQYQSQHVDSSSIQMAELMQFSAMSDGQIIQAINEAGDELGNYVPNFQIDERSGLDWLDWFNMDVNK